MLFVEPALHLKTQPVDDWWSDYISRREMVTVILERFGMSPEFKALLAEHILLGLDAMISFAEFLDGCPFQVDLQAGRIIAGERAAPIGAVGTWAKAPTNSWLWAWANPGWQELPDATLRPAKSLLAYGKANDIPELTSSEISMDDDAFGFHVAAIACGLTGAVGAFQYEHDGGSAFFVMPTLSYGTNDHASRHISVITQGLQAYDVPHRKAVSSYLIQKGYQLSNDPNVVSATRNEDVISVSYDEIGRMKNIEGAMKPNAKRGSASGFFSRLFKK